MSKVTAIVLVFLIVFLINCGKKEEVEVVREPRVAQETPEPVPEAEPVTQPEPEIEVPVREDLGPRYVIQVAAWERLEDAAWMADWMGSLGYDAWVETAYIPSMDMEYHRVRTGNFTDYRKATEEAIEISTRIGSGYWVVKVS